MRTAITYPTQRVARPYLAAAAVSLLLGALFGVLSGMTHGWPALLSVLPLTRLRSLHTTFSVAWIFLAYMGALFHVVPQVVGRDWPFPRLARAQLALFGVAGLVASAAFALGRSTGREYLEFPLLTSALILLGYALFLVNFFALVRHRPRPWPTYLWMWSTGLALFPVTFIEAHAYLLAFYSDNPVRDHAVQWKSYGTLIGTWNMVLYGLSLWLTERLSGDPKVGRSKESYLLYWLGLTNLLFGFAHHTYSLPQALWLRQLSYAISMTEWAILLHMFWSRLARRPSPAPSSVMSLPRSFLGTANVWMAINLTLALLISIPRLNSVTHGSHVTVAHAMGSTIGINTMILFAVALAVLVDGGARLSPWLEPARRVTHASLFVFFVSLVGAGLAKGLGMTAWALPFHDVMEGLPRVFLRVMAMSGVVLGLGLGACAGLLLAALRVRGRAAVARPSLSGRVARAADVGART